MKVRRRRCTFPSPASAWGNWFIHHGRQWRRWVVRARPLGDLHYTLSLPAAEYQSRYQIAHFGVRIKEGINGEAIGVALDFPNRTRCVSGISALIFKLRFLSFVFVFLVTVL